MDEKVFVLTSGQKYDSQERDPHNFCEVDEKKISNGSFLKLEFQCILLSCTINWHRFKWENRKNRTNIGPSLLNNYLNGLKMNIVQLTITPRGDSIFRNIITHTINVLMELVHYYPMTFWSTTEQFQWAWFPMWIAFSVIYKNFK